MQKATPNSRVQFSRSKDWGGGHGAALLMLVFEAGRGLSLRVSGQAEEGGGIRAETTAIDSRYK